MPEPKDDPKPDAPLPPQTDLFTPTDIPASKVNLDDLPEVVASRAPETLPERTIGISIVIAALFTLVVVGAIILFIAALLH